MSVLVISDTHSKHENLETLLKKEEPFDLAVHLGDAEGCEDKIRAMAGCPLEIVAGNCDFMTALPMEQEIEIGRHRVFLTHGHYYNVNAGYEDIKKEARGRDCGIVMFGHTHRPLVFKGKHIIAVNPGSLSYPRQDGRKPSYIVMNVSASEEPDFQICYL